MAQITPITSESLQAKVRQLLPSQVGFGEDLQASNVIIPMVDLTETATGSSLREDLQKALHIGGTEQLTNNTTDTIANVAGFYRVLITFVSKQTAGTDITGKLEITDGSTTRIILRYELDVSTGQYDVNVSNDIVVFLDSGQSLQQTSSQENMFISSYNRQIADINGNLVNPLGFTSE